MSWKNLKAVCDNNNDIIEQLRTYGVNSLNDVEQLYPDDVDAIILTGVSNAPVIQNRLREITENVDREKIQKKLWEIKDLNTLCLRDFSVLSSLEVRGVLNIDHALEMTRDQIRQLGLTDLVVRRRLIEYSKKGGKKSVLKKKKSLSRKVTSSKQNSAKMSSSVPLDKKDLEHSEDIIRSLDSGNLTLRVIKDIHFIMAQRGNVKDDARSLFDPIFDLLALYIDQVTDELGDELVEKIVTGVIVPAASAPGFVGEMSATPGNPDDIVIPDAKDELDEKEESPADLLAKAQATLSQIADLNRMINADNDDNDTAVVKEATRPSGPWMNAYKNYVRRSSITEEEQKDIPIHERLATPKTYSKGRAILLEDEYWNKKEEERRSKNRERRRSVAEINEMVSRLAVPKIKTQVEQKDPKLEEDLRVIREHRKKQKQKKLSDNAIEDMTRRLSMPKALTEEELEILNEQREKANGSKITQDEMNRLIARLAMPKSPGGSRVSSRQGSRMASPGKSPRRSPRASPRASPRRSPRASPRRSPRASPRRSPRRSPRARSRQDSNEEAVPGTLEDQEIGMGELKLRGRVSGRERVINDLTEQVLDRMWISFESHKPKYYVRLARNQKFALKLAKAKTEEDRMDCTFCAIEGLSSENSVSFEHTMFPDYFVVHFDDRVKVKAYVDQRSWRKTASWRIVPGLNGDDKYVSIESVARPDHFIREDVGLLKLLRRENSDSFKRQSSFRIRDGLFKPANYEDDTEELVEKITDVAKTIEAERAKQEAENEENDDENDEDNDEDNNDEDNNDEDNNDEDNNDEDNNDEDNNDDNNEEEVEENNE